MINEWQTAVRNGNFDAVRTLISGGANINAKDRHGQTALMVASKNGYAAIVQLLADSGAELNTTAKYNLSALMLAVINDHADIVKALVKAGADPEIRGTGAPGFFGKTALMLAEDAG